MRQRVDPGIVRVGLLQGGGGERGGDLRGVSGCVVKKREGGEGGGSATCFLDDAWVRSRMPTADEDTYCW